MGEPQRKYGDAVPPDVEEKLRAISLALPDAYEEAAWVGTRWMVRKRTFAHVLTIEFDGGSPQLVLTFRSSGEELDTLLRIGPPFVALGWGRNAIGLLLDEATDWSEVRELLTESYCVMAPKKLAELAQRSSSAPAAGV